MNISARISRLDPSAYDLTSGARRVGWLRRGAVGFTGFDDEERARDAAAIAAMTLRGWYPMRWRSSTPLAWEGKVHPGDCVEADEQVVGRLVKPRDAEAGDAAFGFELRVPDELWIATALELGQRIWSAMREAGVAPGADVPRPAA